MPGLENIATFEPLAPGRAQFTLHAFDAYSVLGPNFAQNIELLVVRAGGDSKNQYLDYWKSAAPDKFLNLKPKFSKQQGSSFVFEAGPEVVNPMAYDGTGDYKLQIRDQRRVIRNFAVAMKGTAHADSMFVDRDSATFQATDAAVQAANAANAAHAQKIAELQDYAKGESTITQNPFAQNFTAGNGNGAGNNAGNNTTQNAESNPFSGDVNTANMSNNMANRDPSANFDGAANRDPSVNPFAQNVGANGTEFGGAGFAGDANQASFNQANAGQASAGQSRSAMPKIIGLVAVLAILCGAAAYFMGMFGSNESELTAQNQNTEETESESVASNDDNASEEDEDQNDLYANEACRLDNSTLSDQAVISRCLGAKPKDEVINQLLKDSLRSGRCEIALKILSSKARSEGGTKYAYVYALMSDPQQSASSQCIVKKTSEADYWYGYVQRDRDFDQDEADDLVEFLLK